MSQAYDGSKVLRAAMKPSPSALYNNLALAGSSSLFYAHNQSACMVALSSVVNGTPAQVRRVDAQNADPIYCIKAFTHDDNTYVLVGTEGGLQIWDRYATHLLHVWTFPESDHPAPGARTATFVRGAAVNIAADGTSNICFGSSLGNLHVIEFGSGGFSTPFTFPHHQSPITCIGSAYQSRQGRWSDDLGCKLVTCDEEGQIVVWDGQSAGSYTPLHTIPATGAPVTSVAVRNDFIIAARLDGGVQIFGLNDGKLRSEIASHSRWLTAMDIHPAKDVIATVSEDCTINVWTLPIGAQKAVNLLSSTWMNAMLTGVAFCGPTFDDVAVVAMDTEELHMFKLLGGK